MSFLGDAADIAAQENNLCKDYAEELIFRNQAIFQNPLSPAEQKSLVMFSKTWTNMGRSDEGQGEGQVAGRPLLGGGLDRHGDIAKPSITHESSNIVGKMVNATEFLDHN